MQSNTDLNNDVMNELIISLKPHRKIRPIKLLEDIKQNFPTLITPDMVKPLFDDDDLLGFTFYLPKIHFKFSMTGNFSAFTDDSLDLESKYIFHVGKDKITCNQEQLFKTINTLL